MKKHTTQAKRQKSEGKKKYRVRNWKEYNEALVNRGKVTFWVTEDALRQWREHQKTGKRGAPKFFSNLAIETALTLREVFRLPLRQTEGFLADILERMGALVKAPDYSTLSLRSETLPIIVRVRAFSEESVHVVLDSTGMKVYGEGEWKVRKHGWSKRRTWRKLHLGLDEATNDILLGEVTGNDAADCEMFAPLLNQLPDTASITQVSADGAYDTRACYDELERRGVQNIAIPPQKNARIRQHGNTEGHPLPRDQTLRRIREVGRQQWKQESGYHRRSIAETVISRLKTIFSDKVRARLFPRQRVELLLRCNILNRMTLLGMPESYLVA